MRITLAALLLALCGPASASAQYTAARVTFQGAGKLPQAGLEQVSGMHAGQKFSTESLQAAAQKLVDTGYFDDVGAGVESGASGMTVKFVLKPGNPAQTLPVEFANFVWLSPAELDHAVHEAAPLFSGRLPEAGNQADIIAHALEAALRNTGVTAHVGYATAEPTTLSPVRRVSFRVEAPAVRVHSVALTGVPAELQPRYDKLLKRLQGMPYSAGPGSPLADDLLKPLRDAGDLDAELAEWHASPSPVAQGRVEVDITAAVAPGSPYKVTSLTFAGTPVAPASLLSGPAVTKAGDVASQARLLESLQPVEDAYRKQGYTDVYLNFAPQKDAAAHTVSYTVAVTPGEPYHLRQVHTVNLPPAAQAQFDANWHMKPGDPYNPLYVQEFLKNNTALRELNRYRGRFQASADPATHLVDLTIRFMPADAKDDGGGDATVTASPIG